MITILPELLLYTHFLYSKCLSSPENIFVLSSLVYSSLLQPVLPYVVPFEYVRYYFPCSFCYLQNQFCPSDHWRIIHSPEVSSARLVPLSVVISYLYFYMPHPVFTLLKGSAIKTGLYFYIIHHVVSLKYLILRRITPCLYQMMVVP